MDALKTVVNKQQVIVNKQHREAEEQLIRRTAFGKRMF